MDKASNIDNEKDDHRKSDALQNNLTRLYNG